MVFSLFFQCGGGDYDGSTCCRPGYECTVLADCYSAVRFPSVASVPRFEDSPSTFVSIIRQLLFFVSGFRRFFCFWLRAVVSFCFAFRAIVNIFRQLLLVVPDISSALVSFFQVFRSAFVFCFEIPYAGFSFCFEVPSGFVFFSSRYFVSFSWVFLEL